MGLTQITHDDSPIFMSAILITSAWCLLLCNMIYSQIPGIRAWTSLEALCLPLGNNGSRRWAYSDGQEETVQSPLSWSLPLSKETLTYK